MGRTYNEHHIEAAICNLPKEKSETMFSKFSLEELYGLYDVFSESPDYSIKEYKNVISRVIEKKKAGTCITPTEGLTKNESFLIDVAITILADYLRGMDEELEEAKSHGLYVQRQVKKSSLYILNEYNDGSHETSTVKRMLLRLERDDR